VRESFIFHLNSETTQPVYSSSYCCIVAKSPPRQILAFSICADSRQVRFLDFERARLHLEPNAPGSQLHQQIFAADLSRRNPARPSRRLPGISERPVYYLVLAASRRFADPLDRLGLA
jgi:hypothetical protein